MISLCPKSAPHTPVQYKVWFSNDFLAVQKGLLISNHPLNIIRDNSIEIQLQYKACFKIDK